MTQFQKVNKCHVFLYRMRYHFVIMVILKTFFVVVVVVVVVVALTAILSFAFASEIEYANASRKELIGIFLFAL